MALTLFLASANSGKLREFRQAARGVVVERLPGLEKIAPSVEDGATFDANARQKASHFSRWVEGKVFADDSGICVDALGGAPGVHSARFAGPGATDDANNQKLLAALRDLEASSTVQRASRNAHYDCVIALAENGRVLTVVEGRVDGLILHEARGAGGFGYDPYFFYPPLGKTFAELSRQEKFGVSHRGEAFRKLLDFLKP